MDDMKPAHTGIGEPVRRKEDLRLITGSGTYADDIPAKAPLKPRQYTTSRFGLTPANLAAFGLSPVKRM